MVDKTWNPADKASGITLSEGDLLASNNSGITQALVRATGPITNSLKAYFEVGGEGTFSAGGNFAVGLAQAAGPLTQWLGQNAQSWGYWASGSKFHNNSGTAFGAGYTNGAIIGIARNGAKMWWSLNGTWQGGGDPAADTSPAYSNLSGDVYPAATPWINGSKARAKFLSTDLAYPVPDGFVAYGGSPITWRIAGTTREDGAGVAATVEIYDASSNVLVDSFTSESDGTWEYTEVAASGRSVYVICKKSGRRPQAHGPVTLDEVV